MSQSLHLTPPQQQLGHSEHENDSGPLRRHFVPKPQYELKEYTCPEMGHRYNAVHVPEGRQRTTPMACKKCETCLSYRKYLKFQQWQASATSATSTYLLAEFPTPNDAAYFAGLKGLLSRQEKIIKITVLHQSGKGGPDQPCWVRVIWDCAATNRQITNVRKRARASGGRRLKTAKIVLSEEQFIKWMPDKFRMQAAKTKNRKSDSINTCRFPKGCAQPIKIPDDWRDGLRRNAAMPRASGRSAKLTQVPRGVMIRESWRRRFLKDPDSPEANRRLERARYINAMDWMTRWMELDEENSNLDASEVFIKAYLAGRDPDVKAWQEQTHGSRHMIIETARWLNGERDPDPATMLVAEGLRLSNQSVEPHIDPDFLHRLTLILPAIELQTA